MLNEREREERRRILDEVQVLLMSLSRSKEQDRLAARFIARLTRPTSSPRLHGTFYHEVPPSLARQDSVAQLRPGIAIVNLAVRHSAAGFRKGSLFRDCGICTVPSLETIEQARSWVLRSKESCNGVPHHTGEPLLRLLHNK